MTVRKDITGKRFGKLVATKATGKQKYKANIWECLCDCGNKFETIVATLNRGSATSCGCSKKERIGKLNRKPAGESAKNRLLSNYKRAAKRRNLDFQLTKEEFEILTQGECHYCGSKPFTSTSTINPNGHSQILYNGIDRKDNNMGYILANCVSCCKNCNFAKYEFSYESFLAYIDRLVNFHVTKNSCHI
jgi:hypothetical protein